MTSFLQRNITVLAHVRPVSSVRVLMVNAALRSTFQEQTAEEHWPERPLTVRPPHSQYSDDLHLNSAIFEIPGGEKSLSHET